MAAAGLKSADYKKILEFNYLDLYSEDYHKQVLALMRERFGWNLVVYTRWSSEGGIATYYSIGFGDDFISSIHKHYLMDKMRDRVAKQHISNSWNGIFYSQDIDLSGLLGSKTLDYLHEHDIYYFAILFLAADPMEHYVLCKTKAEGAFSDWERAVLQQIYGVVSWNLAYRREYQKEKNTRRVFHRYFDEKETGMILADEEWNILDFNDAVFSMIPREMNLLGIDEIGAHIRTLFGSCDEKNNVTKYGRTFSLEEVSVLNEDRKQQRFFIVMISRNKQYDIALDSEIAARYGLTERELQIAELLSNGYSNKNIAEKLVISISTVKIHVSNLFRKLQVHTRMEAILKLTKESLIV